MSQQHRSLPLVPASFFAIVLGLLGLGNSWRAAVRLWALPSAIGESIVALGLAAWLVLLVAYVAKWIAAPAAARAEIADPVQCCFVGLAGVATMLAAIGILPYSPPVALAILVVGGLYTLFFGVWRTGLVWRGGRAPATSTPVLYLPLVAGCFVASTALSLFGAPDWGQLAFGGGLFSWLAIESVLLHRLYTADPLTDALRPTLGIQLAPPTVGAVAYLNATGSSGDIIVHAMLGYGILQAVLLLRMLGWITNRRFLPSLWSFSFGGTALATATITLVLRGDTGAIAVLAPIAFAAANLLVAILAIGTLILLFTGRLLPKPAAPTP